MILSVTFSKPGKDVAEKLGKEYVKIKAKIENSSEGTGYFLEMFTQTQVFHQHFTKEQLDDFILQNAGTTFKNVVKRTQSEEITLMTNKKGKTTELRKPLSQNHSIKTSNQKNQTIPGVRLSDSSKKNYLLQEGNPVPFLVMLGIMTPEGKVISSRYDKFRQINRFLEFIDDILPQILPQNAEQPVRIADFGCGKSYLTFALHYFLTEIKKVRCQIEGLDLKKDVIDYCNDMASKLGLDGLIFHTGNISDYSGKENPDLVVTLHACDTATDFALKYAVERNARAILSVPCCQHQINQQLQKHDVLEKEFEPLLKWGIIREKFSSLVTDALRGEWLESQGYKVQMLEFIDMEHTPKNILIRAVKKNPAKQAPAQQTGNSTSTDLPELAERLKVSPEIWKE